MIKKTVLKFVNNISNSLIYTEKRERLNLTDISDKNTEFCLYFRTFKISINDPEREPGHAGAFDPAR